MLPHYVGIKGHNLYLSKVFVYLVEQFHEEFLMYEQLLVVLQQ